MNIIIFQKVWLSRIDTVYPTKDRRRYLIFDAKNKYLHDYLLFMIIYY